MNLDAKLELLADAARFDVCDSFSQTGRRYTPKRALLNNDLIVDGRNARSRPLFQVLMSNSCAWNCAYCPLRAANDVPRAALEPDELARIFLPRYESGAVQGLFLSTAVDNGVSRAVQRMLDGVELLRVYHRYDGYVHVKLLPGATRDDIERAAWLADRLSLNLEAPGPEHLQRISPERNWRMDLIERLLWARDWQRTAGRLSAGLATQFVVGAAGERDRDLLLTGAWLYRELDLRRVYFGAFRPVVGTPLEEREPTPFIRVQRVHQADWLARSYGFDVRELPFSADGDLPLHLDPKLAWALKHPEYFPVEINAAPPETLLRVPGFGPVSVARIVRLRRAYPFRTPEQLAKLSSQAGRARDFVTLDGRFFGRDEQSLQRHYAPRGPTVAEQLRLWD